MKPFLVPYVAHTERKNRFAYPKALILKYWDMRTGRTQPLNQSNSARNRNSTYEFRFSTDVHAMVGRTGPLVRSVFCTLPVAKVREPPNDILKKESR